MHITSQTVFHNPLFMFYSDSLIEPTGNIFTIYTHAIGRCNLFQIFNLFHDITSLLKQEIIFPSHSPFSSVIRSVNKDGLDFFNRLNCFILNIFPYLCRANKTSDQFPYTRDM